MGNNYAFGVGSLVVSGGTQTQALSNLTFDNSPTVTFGLDGAILTASAAAGAGGGSVNFSAGTTSGNLDSVVFSNSNGVSFGLNGSTITGSHNALTSQSNQALSGQNGSFTFQTASFSNANGISFGTSAGPAITASHNALTSQSNQAFSADASSTFQTLTFQDSNGISFSNNAGAIRLTHALQFTSNTSAITSAALHTSAALRAIYDGANSISTGTIRFTNANGVSFSINGQTISGSVSQSNQQMTMFATGNTTQSSTGTSNASSLIFRGEGVASVGITGGSVVISVPAGGGGLTNINISAGTTSQNLSNIVFSNSNGVSFGLNGSTITGSVNAAGGGVTLSSYVNMPGGLWGTSAVTFGVTSLSSAVAFEMPQAGSFSFLRIPVLMTMASTTIATIASATATAQMGQTSTWNIVIYSVNTGASSRSLLSVASGSGTVNISARISITNSTQYSVSLAYSGLVEGAGTTRTTQYSISNTNYSFTTNQFTEFSSNRWLDIPFANSLAAGQYWLVMGRSTSSSSAGAGLTAMTSWGPRYSNHYAGTMGNLLFGIMGSTNMTSIGVHIGAGVFSTAGGGTTSAFPMSAISSTASNPMMYFQLLRSA